MPNMTKTPCFIFLFIMFVGACSGGGGSSSTGSPSDPPPAGKITVTISPNNVSINTGGAQSLLASVVGTNNTAVTWSLEEGNGCGTITQNGAYGNYNAPATITGASATCHVRAASQADPTASGTATITISPRQSGSSLVPLKIISRGVPAYASSGNASNGNGPDYTQMWDSGNGNETGAWLAYDLSSVPEANRQTVLAFWTSNGGIDHTYNQGTDYGTPGQYVIEGSANSTNGSDGTWTQLVVSRDNATSPTHSYKCEEHLFSMAGYTWIRFRVTANNPNNDQTWARCARIKFDIYDASSGGNDDFFMMGDSVTAGGWQWDRFAMDVNARNSAFSPVLHGAGIPYWKTSDAVQAAQKWIVTDQLLSVAKYVGISFGTNDAGGVNGSPNSYDNYLNDSSLQSVYDSLLAIGNILRQANKTGIVPTTHWSTNQTLARSVQVVNARRGYCPDWTPNTNYTQGACRWSHGRSYLATTAGTSASAGGPSGTSTTEADSTVVWRYFKSLREDHPELPIIPGPDLYAVFENRADLMADTLHPNDAGYTVWQKAWADWAVNTLYPDTPPPANTCGSAIQWQSCGQGATQAFGNYTVYNNMWASNSGSCMWAQSSSCWGARATYEDLGGYVKTYDSAMRGDHYSQFPISGNGMPVGPLSGISALSARWNMQTPKAGRYMALWDIYFRRTNGVYDPNTNPYVANLMLFQYYHDRTGWIGSDSDIGPNTPGWIGQKVFSGITWKCKYGLDSSRNMRVMTCYATPPTENATLDLKEIIDFAVSKGYFDPSWYLTVVEAGWEIIEAGGSNGTGLFQTTDFRVALPGETQLK